MNTSRFVLAVDGLLSGQPTPGDISVLRDTFQRYCADDTASLNAVINGSCPKGLRNSLKELRWRRHITEAVSLIDHPGATTHSLAVTLARELSRLQRTHRPATDPLGQALQAALLAHPNGGTSIAALWPIVDEARQV